MPAACCATANVFARCNGNTTPARLWAASASTRAHSLISEAIGTAYQPTEATAKPLLREQHGQRPGSSTLAAGCGCGLLGDIIAIDGAGRSCRIPLSPDYGTVVSTHDPERLRKNGMLMSW